MDSRKKILEKIKANKPQPLPPPAEERFDTKYADLAETFGEMVNTAGGVAVLVSTWPDIKSHLFATFGQMTNRATTIPFLADWADFSLNVTDPHDLEMINVAVIEADFGVAENGAVWVSERHLTHRVLPFIAQYLAVVIPKHALVDTMHDAYERVNLQETGWGCFIAGPSKTADIEQSLVIGAHGARSLTVFLLDEQSTEAV